MNYKRPQIGDIAPDFNLKDHNGKDFKLSDFQGKKVLISFHLFKVYEIKHLPNISEISEFLEGG